MSSKIVAAVPNSLLTNNSRSGSRSKSAKTRHGIPEHNQAQSKSLAANRGLMQTGGSTRDNIPASLGPSSMQPGPRVGSLALASASSHNLVNNKPSEF